MQDEPLSRNLIQYMKRWVDKNKISRKIGSVKSVIDRTRKGRLENEGKH